MSDNILVIKHGALGDIVIATAAMRAIRTHHPHAHITLLTSKAYAELLSKSPYFNEIWVDSKPKWNDIQAIRELRALLNSKPWSWVYDLQTSERTTFYQWLLKRPWPNISNVSRWSSHGYTDPARHTRHSLENDRYQLAIAGIADIGMPDVSWMADNDEADNNSINFLRQSIEFSGWHQRDWNDFLDQYDPAKARPYALLVPGGAAHRPAKRWPAENYAVLAEALVSKGIIPVLIGTDAERDALIAIHSKVTATVNLCGKTSITQLATLARQAACAVGNDTGPMHVIAATGCPSTVLFSRDSDPARSAPIGPNVTILREMDLRDLSVDRVLATCPLTQNLPFANFG